MFVIDVDECQYLITAQHVVEGFGPSGTLEISQSGKWVPIDVLLVGHHPDEDVTAFRSPTFQAPPISDVTVGVDDFYYSQEVYFLGFPFGWKGAVSSANNGYPLPFARRAIISMLDIATGGTLYLDGFNNIGFSGAPVAHLVLGSGAHGTDPTWSICGVVSGFHDTHEWVKNKDEDTPLSYFSTPDSFTLSRSALHWTSYPQIRTRTPPKAPNSLTFQSTTVDGPLSNQR